MSDSKDISAQYWLKRNDRTMEASKAWQMAFSVATLISHISRFMTLLPGEVISIGAPPGLGLGQKPPLYLPPGDIVELGLTGLGSQRQQAVAAQHPCPSLSPVMIIDCHNLVGATYFLICTVISPLPSSISSPCTLKGARSAWIAGLYFPF